MNKYYLDYLKLKNYSQNTIQNYLKYTNEALNYINKAESEITYADVLQWINTFNNLAINTQNIRISALRNYFNFLLENNEIQENPLKQIKRKKIHEGEYKEKPFIDPHYLRDMINVTNNKKEKAIILLYATTGLRVSELINITLKDYLNMKGEEGRELEIIGKGSKKRFVYVNNETKEAIDNYLNSKERKDHTSEFLFISRQGNKIAINNLNGTIKKIAKKAKIPFWKNMSNHCLRAAFATSKNIQGISLPVIQKAMGHVNLSTTLLYIKSNQAQVNNSMRTMAF